MGDGAVLVHDRQVSGRAGSWHLHGRGAAIHFGDVAAGTPRTPGRLTCAPQIDVAAKAIDVSKLYQQISQSDEAKRRALEAQLTEAQTLLVTAAAEGGYGGPAVQIPTAASMATIG